MRDIITMPIIEIEKEKADECPPRGKIRVIHTILYLHVLG